MLKVVLNQKTFNFYVGAEFTQAFTQSRRSYDFFTQSQDLQKRNDYLIGLKFNLADILYFIYIYIPI
jgi:hypothetical protein